MKDKPLRVSTKRGYIIELAGIPGAGKTTLMSALDQRIDNLEWIFLEHYRYTGNVAFFFYNFILLIPLILRTRISVGEWFSHRDLAQMIMLNGLPGVARRKAMNKIVIFEEGCVALISQMHRRNSLVLRCPTTGHWWKKIYKEWSETLDMIIELDAPVKTIVRRIRNRNDQFEVADMSDEVAIKYFNEIQRTQENLLFIFESRPQAPCILRFNSMQKSPEQIGDDVLTILNC
ncbi:MAG TPA: hypothetical protein VK897_02645 [Anaerolineales bacterium]|nr:hypothetical protein [Anaerolineales bacterium]